MQQSLLLCDLNVCFYEPLAGPFWIEIRSAWFSKRIFICLHSCSNIVTGQNHSVVATRDSPSRQRELQMTASLPQKTCGVEWIEKVSLFFFFFLLFSFSSLRFSFLFPLCSFIFSSSAIFDMGTKTLLMRDSVGSGEAAGGD